MLFSAFYHSNKFITVKNIEAFKHAIPQSLTPLFDAIAIDTKIYKSEKTKPFTYKINVNSIKN